MWSDSESAIDYLGFSVHEQLIRQIVTNDLLLPVTVGVFGDWGGGKSSILRMLQRQLESEGNEHEDIACLYFSGWMFEGYDDAKSALISSILMQLGEHQKIGPKIRGKVARLLKAVDRMRLARLFVGRAAIPAAGILAATGMVDPGTATLIASGAASVAGTAAGVAASSDGTASVINDALETVDWQKLKSNASEDETSPSVRAFRAQFSKLIDDTGLRALVILVDDLDRCSPERLVENLEAIKLFLSVPKTAFVIAADNLIVRHAISSRYQNLDIRREQSPGNEEPSRDLVTDYVEKLIQIPYHLPRLSPNEIETYITLLFCRLHLDNSAFDALLDTCNIERGDNPDIAFGNLRVAAALNNQVPEPLVTQLQWASAIAPALAEGLKGNPRQVKRFLNALLLRKQLSTIARLPISDDILVKLMLLEYSNYPRFLDLYKWQASSSGRPTQIADLERAARAEPDPTPGDTARLQPVPNLQDWQDGKTQAWLRLDPPLGEVDLRDYFWVARDRLQGAIGGLSLLSLRVRRLLDQILSPIEAERIATARAILDLEDHERADLIRAVKDKYQRHPEDAVAFRSLVAMVDGNVAGSLDALLEAVGSIAPSAITPDTGFELDRIVAVYPAARDRVNQLFDRWSSAGGRIGATVQQIRSDNRDGGTGRRN